MAEASSVPEESRAKIGKEFTEPFVFEVEKGAIRLFAEAIEDPNPLYTDENYANNSRYGAMIAPPIMVGTIGLPQLQMAQIQLPVGNRKNYIARGCQIEYFQPVKAGDVLTVTYHLDDLEEQESRLGHMVTIWTTRTFTNQEGVIVAKERMGLSRY